MKPWVACFLVACSGERSRPPERDPVVPSEARTSIDLATTGPPVAIRGVELTARDGGDLEVTYRVEAFAPALVPARIMCRVGERNLVYPMSATGKVAGPRLSSLFRAAPFRERASTCQVDFFYAPSEPARWAPAGHACLEAGALRDGACPATSFPAPVLPTAGAVVLEQASIELHDSSATVTALFSLTQPVSADRRFVATIACEDKGGKVGGEAPFSFVPLDQLPVGASMFGPVTFALERTPHADAKCGLDIVSRTVGDGPGGDRIHAQYCLSTGAVRAGRC